MPKTLVERIDDIRDALPPRARPQFEQLIEYMARSPYDYLSHVLQAELDRDEPDVERCLVLLDELEEALRRFFDPLPTQARAYVKDRETWFWIMREQLKVGRPDAARDNMPWFRRMFNPGGKEVCGAARTSCRYADKGAYPPEQHCMTHYRNDLKEAVICPNCGGGRLLCAMERVMPNGYCHFHGGRVPDRENSSMPILRGDRIYGAALAPTSGMRRRFAQFQDDPDALVLIPEINLLRARIADQLERIEEFDVTVIEKGMHKALERLRRAVDEDNEGAVYDALMEMEAYLDAGAQGKRTWQEAENSIALLARVAGEERRRATDAQQMMMRQEVNALVEELLQEMRALLGTMAERNIIVLSRMFENHLPHIYKDIARALTTYRAKDRLLESMTRAFEDALVAAEEFEARDERREELLELQEGVLEGEFYEEDED